MRGKQTVSQVAVHGRRETLVATAGHTLNLTSMPRLALILCSAFLLPGCIHVKLEPVEINATVNVNVKVDRALDDFFGDLDKKSATLNSTPAAK
jgi:hypothetical protein